MKKVHQFISKNFKKDAEVAVAKPRYPEVQYLNKVDISYLIDSHGSSGSHQDSKLFDSISSIDFYRVQHLDFKSFIYDVILCNSEIIPISLTFESEWYYNNTTYPTSFLLPRQSELITSLINDENITNVKDFIMWILKNQSQR